MGHIESGIVPNLCTTSLASHSSAASARAYSQGTVAPVTAKLTINGGKAGSRSCYAHTYEIACNLLEDLRLRAVRLCNHDGRAAV